MNLVSFSDHYSRSTIIREGDVANDANANAVRNVVRALVDIYNNNQQANLGFSARHSITTGPKQVT